jgi:ABC transport system ATP-binding/permease protein
MEDKNARTMVRSEFSDDGPLPPGLLIQLKFLSGPKAGTEEKLYKRNTVMGRSEGDIHLNDNASSRKHASIIYDDGHFSITDLGSTNGTSLNGAGVFEAYLNHNDEITIGETVIRVEIQQLSKSASWAYQDTADAPGAGQESEDNETTNVQLDRKDPLGGALAPGMKIGLQVSEGLDNGLKLLCEKRGTLIGRGTADFALHDLDVSRKHACIEVMGPDRVIIKDLRSKNGTFLNGKWTTVGNLKHGDTIKIGKTIIKVFLQLK